MVSYEWPPITGGGGVTSLNGITGDILLVGGTGISISTLAQDITITNTGVTSVALAAPVSILSVSGSPVTSTGTLTLSLVSQAQNTVWAGPTSGSGNPTFRLLTSGDIPALSYVTSVALADSTGTFNITGSPVTGSGTLTLSSFVSQSANTFLAAPNGSSGAPSFRLIVPADVPTLNQNTTGTAANITATSNSTLTTLTVLSLPGSQVTGNISGNAANITATSNSTLTTLTALSLPTSQLTGMISLTTQVSGILPIANGGTSASSANAGFDNLSPMTTAGDIIYENATPTATNLPIGTTGQVLTVVAGLPAWQTPAVTLTPVALNYQVNQSFTIPNSTTTLITYGAPLFDTNSIYNSTTGTGTIPTTGYYWIGASLYYNGGNATGSRTLELWVNGSFAVYISDQVGISGGVYVLGSLIWSFNSGDTFQIQATQASGASISTLGGGNVEYFSMNMVH